MSNTPYKLRYFNPYTNEKCELPLNDISVAFMYKNKKSVEGMENVEVFSEWNKNTITPIKMNCV